MCAPRARRAHHPPSAVELRDPTCQNKTTWDWHVGPRVAWSCLTRLLCSLFVCVHVCLCGCAVCQCLCVLVHVRVCGPVGVLGPHFVQVKVVVFGQTGHMQRLVLRAHYNLGSAKSSLSISEHLSVTSH